MESRASEDGPHCWSIHRKSLEPCFYQWTENIQEFVHVVDSILPAKSAELVYWDDLIGRIQFNWLDPRKFDPEEIKTALSDFGPLVWSERLLGSNVVVCIQPSTRSDWHLEDIQWTAGPVSNGSSLEFVWLMMALI